MNNRIASETNGTTSGTNGGDLLRCPHCGGEVAIALHSNEFGEYWWTVQRGHDDATACKCRLFMESDKFCLDVEEGEQAKDSPWAMELRARLVGKWNRRVAVTDHDFAMAVHDGRTWVCAEAAMESDVLKPIPGFTRDSIYRDSMREYGEWMGKATALMRDIWTTTTWEYGMTDECRDELRKRLEEFGIEV